MTAVFRLAGSVRRDPRIEAWTDREGRFTLARVPSGGQTAWIWRTGFAQKRIDLEIPSDAPEHALDVQLEESHFIGGVVLGDDGAPLPWTLVYAEGSGRALESIEGFQSYTGADGRFRIAGLPAVHIKVGAVAHGRARVELEAPALDREDLELRMMRSRAGPSASVSIPRRSAAWIARGRSSTAPSPPAAPSTA